MSSGHDAPLNRRCALFALLAMTLAIGAGLLAWGPILLPQSAHSYADARALAGVANGVNAMACLPMLLVGLWGWRALGRGPCPASLLRPGRGYFGFVVVAAGSAAVYHLMPGDLGYLAAQSSAAGAFAMLLCGCLAERVDARFGSRRACWAVVATVGVAAVATAFSAESLGQMDMRPIMLLQLLPVLLIPAGVLSLPGLFTVRADWLLMLGIYAAARVFDLGDAAVMHYTAAISGHALMHLCMAGVAGWLAYRASASAALVAVEPVDDACSAHATTSLITSG